MGFFRRLLEEWVAQGSWDWIKKTVKDNWITISVGGVAVIPSAGILSNWIVWVVVVSSICVVAACVVASFIGGRTTRGAIRPVREPQMSENLVPITQEIRGNIIECMKLFCADTLRGETYDLNINARLGDSKANNLSGEELQKVNETYGLLDQINRQPPYLKCPWIRTNLDRIKLLYDELLRTIPEASAQTIDTHSWHEYQRQIGMIEEREKNGELKPVRFREAPYQGIADITNPADSRNSWLHMQIDVADKNFRMERVRARLLFENPPAAWVNIPSDGIWLRWQSESRKGDEYKTMEYGVPHLLPMFARYPRMWWARDSRQGETACLITDQNERFHERTEYRLLPGRYTFRVRVFSGSWENISNKYLLNVPHENSENAHFWFCYAESGSD